MFTGPPARGIGGAGGPRGKGIPRVKIEVIPASLRQVMKQMQRVSDAGVEAALKATEEEVKMILDDAKANTPIDRGHLVTSGRMFKPRINKKQGTASFQVVFGGITVSAEGGSRFVDYAVIVHETHPTKSQFLENAAAKRVPGMADRIAKKVKAAVYGAI